MSTDPLDAVRSARERLDRAEEARDLAITALADAIRAAHAAEIRPKAVQDAAGIKASAYYVIVGPRKPAIADVHPRRGNA